MKVRHIVPLACGNCDTPWHPELVAKADDGHFYLLGTCTVCKEAVGANLEKLYCELYADVYSKSAS